LVQTGLRLEQQPAQDMLDIVHYLFESDAIGEKEVQDAKTKLRRTIYGQLYQRTYTWGDASGGREFGTQDVASGDFYSGRGSGTPGLSHKPYVPPTPVNAASARPYGTVLDAPLG
jgi:hypothetical protein